MDSNENVSDRGYLQERIAMTGNRLAELNLIEAEAALRSGSDLKAVEYLQLALELADDVSLRQKAENLLQPSVITNQNAVETSQAQTGAHDCASCSSSHHKTETIQPDIPDSLAPAEKFQLLINTLPNDLPKRYAELGEKFASAYLLAHEDMLNEADQLFAEMLMLEENDIVLYEKGLIHFRAGDQDGCEKLFKRSLQLNSSNPLTHLGLAQLFADTGRFDSASEILSTMINHEILPDQALVMQGDVCIAQGLFDRALEIFTAALESPALKKTAAERLVYILNAQGREPEAAYLAKTYLKGCC
jgi:tetratricopeptide (TPR) repeat protein